VDLCQWDCGGCALLENCGDGQCDAGGGENCANCTGDCTCMGDAVCFKYSCCVPSCEGKECGDDGCGGWCGNCPCPGCPPENTVCGLDGQCALDIASPCKKFMLCLLTCGDDWCMQGCLDQAGPDAMDKYQVWMNCMMANGLEQCWDSVCAFTVWQSCLPEFNECTQGTMACPLVAECLFACGNDGTCGNACLVEGSPSANDALWTFLICAFDGCGGEEFDGGCLDKMAAGQCAGEYAECTGSCTPACGDKECGPDGCDGSCGECPSGSACLAGGKCDDTCKPECEGKECGPDGCGGKCGGCDIGDHCLPTGQCEPDCVPSCDGRECGDDGCGGTCGTCADGETCSGDGLCVLVVEVMPEPLPEVVEMGKDVQAADATDVAAPEATVEGTDDGPETAISSSTSCAGCATNRPEAGGAPLLLLLPALMAWGAMRRVRRA